MPVDASTPISAFDIEPSDIQYIWAERVPRSMITTIAGKPDKGKGLTGALIAADVSKGKGGAQAAVEAGILPEKGGRVLYSPNEDAHDVMTGPRLKAAGANMRNVLIWEFVLPEQMAELRYIVENGTPKNPGKIDLVIIDPFNTHLAGVSKFSDKLRPAVLNPLKRLAEETGCAFIIIEHVNKRIPKGADPLSVIGGGASGLAAASRAAYLFGLDPDNADQRILAPVKFNIGVRPAPFCFEVDTDDVEGIRDPVPLLVPVGETVIDPIKLVQDAKGDDEAAQVGRPNDKRQAACEWLMRYLARAGKPVRAGLVQEDAKQAGITAKTLRRARTDMGIVLDPPGGGKNCTWDLSEDDKQAMGLVPESPTDGMDAATSEPAGADDLTISDDDLRNLLGDS